MPTFGSHANDQAFAGFMAGAMATTLLHPLDLAKVRLQANTAKTKCGFFGATAAEILKIWRSNGLRGLWQGYTANFTGCSVSWAGYFFLYSLTKDRMQNSHEPQAAVLSPGEYLMAAMQAGVTTALLTNPLWVLKTRMCLQSFKEPIYTSYLGAFSSIYQKEGIRGLYRGQVPAMIGVFNGSLQFTIYEQLKKQRIIWPRNDNSSAAASVARHLVNAAVSKICATMIMYPYQVVKTRVQSFGANSLSSVIQSTWAADGPRGFYRGLGANIIRVLPGTCITFLTYETVTEWLQ